MASGESSSSPELISTAGTNATRVLCPKCDSVIMIPNSGKFEKFPKEIPCMSAKGAGDVDRETCEEFWAVSNMFAFENVGYTNAVDGVKYLTCADCEVGPLGYEDSESKISYVALCRVKHV